MPSWPYEKYDWCPKCRRLTRQKVEVNHRELVIDTRCVMCFSIVKREGLNLDGYNANDGAVRKID